MSAVFPVLEDFIKGLLPRNSVVESWTVANPFLFLGVLAYSLDRVSFHTDLLESIDRCPFYAISTASFSLYP